MYRKARTVMCYPDEDACVIDDDSACVLQLVELIAFFPILSVDFPRMLLLFSFNVQRKTAPSTS